jgi:hypothetical protein
MVRPACRQGGEAMSLYIPGRRPRIPADMWKRRWHGVMEMVRRAADGAPQTILAQGDGTETELVLVRRDHPALVGIELEAIEPIL